MKDLKKVIALKYPEGFDAPVINAKGNGLTGESILKIARENNIPVVENDSLVNVLSKEDVGSLVPEEAFLPLVLIFKTILEKKEN